MKMSDFRLHDGAESERGFRVVARFSVEIMPGLAVHDWQLVRAPNGDYLAYPPAGANRRPTVSIDYEIRRDVISMAEREMEFMNAASAA